MNCALCGIELVPPDVGCSAQPLMDERCCRACDDLIVTPVRVARGSGLPIAQAVRIAVETHKSVQRLRELIVMPERKL